MIEIIDNENVKEQKAEDKLSYVWYLEMPNSKDESGRSANEGISGTSKGWQVCLLYTYRGSLVLRVDLVEVNGSTFVELSFVLVIRTEDGTGSMIEEGISID